MVERVDAATAAPVAARGMMLVDANVERAVVEGTSWTADFNSEEAMEVNDRRMARNKRLVNSSGVRSKYQNI